MLGEARGGLSCMHMREDEVLRSDAQEDEEVRRRQEKVNRQEGEQRCDGWRSWRGEQMESCCTHRLCCAGEGESSTVWPPFWRNKKAREVETGRKEISKAVKDTAI